MKLNVIAIAIYAAIATFPAFSAPLQFSETAAGLARVLTSATVYVDGKVIALPHILDLDEAPAFCRWRSPYGQKQGWYQLPPSSDTAENRAVCDKNPGGTWRAPREHKYRCELAYTAVEQASALKKIAEAKYVTCKHASADALRSHWKKGELTSRYGHKLYPGECYIGDSAVSVALLKAGYGQFMRQPYITPIGSRYATPWPEIVDPHFGDKRAFNAAQDKRRKEKSANLLNGKTACNRDHYPEAHPERYNPKPVLK